MVDFFLLLWLTTITLECRALPQLWGERDLNGMKVQGRQKYEGYMYALGGNAYKDDVMIERYNSKDDKWIRAGKMRSERSAFGAAVMDNNIWIVAGRDSSLKTINSCEYWNPKTGQWHDMPAINTPRHHLGVAVVEGILYAVGGEDGSQHFKNMEKWDPDTKTWSTVYQDTTPLGEMSSSRSALGVAALKGKLYAVGGYNGRETLKSVERYDPNTNQWTSLASMNKRRSDFGVGVLNGMLYAVAGAGGGDGIMSSVERYDPAVNKWTLVASITYPRFGLAVCPLNGFLFAAGGHVPGIRTLEDVTYYDPSKDKWVKVSSMTVPRKKFGLVVTNKAP